MAYPRADTGNKIILSGSDLQRVVDRIAHQILEKTSGATGTVLPGIPTAVIYAMAGWARMRLTTFLLLDLAGAFLMTGLVAGVGYGLGQHAVDLVMLVDRFASLVSLTLIALAAVIPLVKRRIRRNN